MLPVMLMSPADLTRAVAARARGRRLGLGLTQEALAARAGVNLHSLRRFERTGKVAFEALARLALALDAAEGVAALFPEPDPRGIADVLARPRRARAPRRAAP